MPSDFEQAVESLKSRLRIALTELDRLAGLLTAHGMVPVDGDARLAFLKSIDYPNPDGCDFLTRSPGDFARFLLLTLADRFQIRVASALVERTRQKAGVETRPQLDEISAAIAGIATEFEGLRSEQRLSTGVSSAQSERVLVQAGYGLDGAGVHENIATADGQRAPALVSREGLKRRLDDWVHRRDLNDQVVFCLEAEGGLGKSILAWDRFGVWQRECPNYQRFIWWSFYGRDCGFERFVVEVCKFLGEEQQDHAKRGVSAVLSLLERAGALVVLDGVERLTWNFNRARAEALKDSIRRDQPALDLSKVQGDDVYSPDIYSFFDKIASLSSCRFLLTTRASGGICKEGPYRDLRDHVYIERLEPLKDDDLWHLWRSINPQELDEATVRTLVARSGRNSLITVILARTVRTHAEGSLRLWLDRHGLIDLLTGEDALAARSRLLRHALEDLEEKPTKVLKVLAALTPPIAFNRVHNMLIAGGLSRKGEESATHALLRSLQDRRLVGLVARNDGGEPDVDIHPIVREHVNGLEKDLELLKTAFSAIPAKEMELPTSVEDLDPLKFQFNMAVSGRVYDEALRIYRDRLRDGYFHLGDNDAIETLLQHFFPEEPWADRLPYPSGDRVGQSLILADLARVQEYSGRHGADVEKLWRRCLVLLRLAGDATLHVDTLCARSGLAVYRLLARECEEDLIRGLGIALDAGLRDRVYQLLCFLGISLALRGEADLAERTFALAERSIDPPNDQRLRWVLQGLAEARVWLGGPPWDALERAWREKSRNDRECEEALKKAVLSKHALGAVERMHRLGDAAGVNGGQRAWEYWTHGAALVLRAECLRRGNGDPTQVEQVLEDAASRLEEARARARRMTYWTVELLARAHLAMHALVRGDRASALDTSNGVVASGVLERVPLASIIGFVVRSEARAEGDVERVNDATQALRLSLKGDRVCFLWGVNRATRSLPFGRNVSRESPDVFPMLLPLLSRIDAALKGGPPAPATSMAPRPEDCGSDARVIAAVRQLGKAEWEKRANRWWEEVLKHYSGRDVLQLAETMVARGMGASAVLAYADAWASLEGFERLSIREAYELMASLEEAAPSPDRRLMQAVPEPEQRRLIKALAGAQRWEGLEHYETQGTLVARPEVWKDLIRDLNAEDVPCFLEDAQSRMGPLPQRGSPVAEWWDLVRSRDPRAALLFAEDLAHMFTETMTNPRVQGQLQRPLEQVFDQLHDQDLSAVRPIVAKLWRSATARGLEDRNISDTSAWSEERVSAHLEEVKASIGWASTKESAHKWWMAFERENAHRLVLRLAEALEHRKATITEFFFAYVYSNTDNIRANLHYLDYTRVKKAVEEWKMGDGKPPAPAPDPFATWTDERPAPPEIPQPSDRPAEAVLWEVKKRLDWDNTTGSSRKWWEALENENTQRLSLVLWLARELEIRKATITDFFLAYVYSNIDNIRANLHYLDYTRVKKQHEQKKREAAKQIAAKDSPASPPA